MTKETQIRIFPLNWWGLRGSTLEFQVIEVLCHYNAKSSGIISSPLRLYLHSVAMITRTGVLEKYLETSSHKPFLRHLKVVCLSYFG